MLTSYNAIARSQIDSTLDHIPYMLLTQFDPKHHPGPPSTTEVAQVTTITTVAQTEPHLGEVALNTSAWSPQAF